MSHMKNKVDWCLKKAKREIESEGKQRGIYENKKNKEKERK